MCCLCAACKLRWRSLGITTKKGRNAGGINFTQFAIQWKCTLESCPRFCTPFCQYCHRRFPEMFRSYVYLRVQSPVLALDYAHAALQECIMYKQLCHTRTLIPFDTRSNVKVDVCVLLVVLRGCQSTKKRLVFISRTSVFVFLASFCS